MNIPQIESRLREYLSFAKKYPHLFLNDKENNSLNIILDYDTLLGQQNILYEKANKKNNPRNFFDIGILTEDNWTITLRDLVKFPNGEYAGYIRMLNKNSSVFRSGKDTVIIPLIDGNKILLLRHFRHEDRKWHYEIPRGFGELNKPIENAAKELKEETGLIPDRIEIIGGESTSVVYLVAYISNVDEIILEHSEGIDSCILVSTDEFKTMILNGKIEDNFTLIATTYAMLKGII